MQSSLYSATTKQLVANYKEQLQHFMTSTTLSQFKKLFPTSMAKMNIKLEYENYWGDNTINDVVKLASLFGSPVDHDHYGNSLWSGSQMFQHDDQGT